jgi:hypothetical protein
LQDDGLAESRGNTTRVTDQLAASAQAMTILREKIEIAKRNGMNQ